MCVRFVLLSTYIYLTLVTSISIITHLAAFLNIALGHFVINYTRKQVVTKLYTGIQENIEFPGSLSIHKDI